MRAWVAKEPELSFGGGSRHVDPKAGLSLYGPFAAEGQLEGGLGTINVGIIGTRDGLSLASSWFLRIDSKISSEQADPLLFPAYPGFFSAFRTRLQFPKALTEQIPRTELDHVLEISDSRQRIGSAAELFSGRMAHFQTSHPHPDVIVCVIPQEMEETCWSAQPGLVTGKLARESRRLLELGQKQLTLSDFDEEPVPVVEASARGSNLRAQLKVGGIRHGLPTQLMLESTLAGGRSVQPPSTVAWNLSVALFYKAGGFPWRLAQSHEGTSFIGISFYRERDWDPLTMGTAIAQVFDDTGEGLILKGGRVEWDVRDARSPHLPPSEAAGLVEKVLAAYRERGKAAPRKMVFHKTSRFWPEELAALREHLPAGTNADFLAIERGDLRVVREGHYPPLRGTCVALSERDYLVYGVGYIPYLGTYPGHHIPSPLRILEHYGDSTPQEVCDQILALTKLNWNTAQYCCGVPMTINVARRVSSVLSELPQGADVNPAYRFYM